MNIAIVGTGYVGLVSGPCFAEMGVNVTCVDVNAEKIKLLQSGQLPIYEPGLDEMVLRNHREGRLNLTTDLISCLDNVDIVYNYNNTIKEKMDHLFFYLTVCFFYYFLIWFS